MGRSRLPRSKTTRKTRVKKKSYDAHALTERVQKHRTDFKPTAPDSEPTALDSAPTAPDLVTDSEGNTPGSDETTADLKRLATFWRWRFGQGRPTAERLSNRADPTLSAFLYTPWVVPRATS